MKKSLIALAALAATASFAQSTVTLKGTFDPSFVVQKDSYTDGHAVTTSGLQNNRQGTSNFTFLGEEDLGGGLKAAFLMENDFDATKQATNNFSSKGGEVYAGLIGGFGSIKLGSPNTPTLYTQSTANPFGTKLGGGFGAMNASHVRNDNSLVYATPVVGGFNAMVGYSNQSKDAAGVTTTASNTDIGLFYANGPVAVGYSNYSTAGIGAGAKTTQNNAYVTYDFGVAKLGAGYYTEQKTGAIDSAAYNVSVNAPLGGGLSLLANVGKKNDKLVANADRTVTAIGLKKDLSKRTSLYARLVTDKTDNLASSATTVGKSTYTVAGLQHNF